MSPSQPPLSPRQTAMPSAISAFNSSALSSSAPSLPPFGASSTDADELLTQLTQVSSRGQVHWSSSLEQAVRSAGYRGALPNDHRTNAIANLIWGLCKRRYESQGAETGHRSRGSGRDGGRDAIHTVQRLEDMPLVPPPALEGEKAKEWKAWTKIFKAVTRIGGNGLECIAHMQRQVYLGAKDACWSVWLDEQECSRQVVKEFGSGALGRALAFATPASVQDARTGAVTLNVTSLHSREFKVFRSGGKVRTGYEAPDNDGALDHYVDNATHIGLFLTDAHRSLKMSNAICPDDPYGALLLERMGYRKSTIHNMTALELETFIQLFTTDEATTVADLLPEWLSQQDVWRTTIIPVFDLCVFAMIPLLIALHQYHWRHHFDLLPLRIRNLSPVGPDGKSSLICVHPAVPAAHMPVPELLDDGFKTAFLPLGGLIREKATIKMHQIVVPERKSSHPIPRNWHQRRQQARTRLLYYTLFLTASRINAMLRDATLDGHPFDIDDRCRRERAELVKTLRVTTNPWGYGHDPFDRVADWPEEWSRLYGNLGNNLSFALRLANPHYRLTAQDYTTMDSIVELVGDVAIAQEVSRPRFSSKLAVQFSICERLEASIGVHVRQQERKSILSVKTGTNFKAFIRYLWPVPPNAAMEILRSDLVDRDLDSGGESIGCAADLPEGVDTLYVEGEEERERRSGDDDGDEEGDEDAEDTMMRKATDDEAATAAATYPMQSSLSQALHHATHTLNAYSLMDAMVNAYLCAERSGNSDDVCVQAAHKRLKSWPHSPLIMQVLESTTPLPPRHLVDATDDEVEEEVAITATVEQRRRIVERQLLSIVSSSQAALQAPSASQQQQLLLSQDNNASPSASLTEPPRSNRQNPLIGFTLKLQKEFIRSVISWRQDHFMGAVAACILQRVQLDPAPLNPESVQLLRKAFFKYWTTSEGSAVDRAQVKHEAADTLYARHVKEENVEGMTDGCRRWLLQSLQDYIPPWIPVGHQLDFDLVGCYDRTDPDFAHDWDHAWDDYTRLLNVAALRANAEHHKQEERSTRAKADLAVRQAMERAEAARVQAELVAREAMEMANDARAESQRASDVALETAHFL